MRVWLVLGLGLVVLLALGLILVTPTAAETSSRVQTSWRDVGDDGDDRGINRLRFNTLGFAHILDEGVPHHRFHEVEKGKDHQRTDSRVCCPLPPPRFRERLCRTGVSGLLRQFLVLSPC